jgi:hypothetical protein
MVAIVEALTRKLLHAVTGRDLRVKPLSIPKAESKATYACLFASQPPMKFEWA